jgi:hypothetical protein
LGSRPVCSGRRPRSSPCRLLKQGAGRQGDSAL